MTVARPELQAVSCPGEWAKSEPQASYAGVVIDGEISLRDADLVKRLIPHTSHFVFVGLKSSDAEEAADWTIVESGEGSPLTSAVSEASAPEVLELLSLTGGTTERQSDFVLVRSRPR